MREEKADHADPIITIKEPAIITIIGLAGLAGGCALSFLCFLDRLHGNETAFLWICLSFLLLPGFPGLWLICYSRRLIQVNGEDITFRDILFRIHRYKMKDVQLVRWETGGYCFLGEEGALFKIYDHCPGCEMLFQELESRGAKIDLPGRCFSPCHMAAFHPCLKKRCFTVCLSPYAGPLADQLTVDGTKLFLHRPFKEDRLLTSSDLDEVRVKEGRDLRLSIKFFQSDGTCLLKCSFVTASLYFPYAIALLIHLSELGIPLSGMETADESIGCMMRSCYITRDNAQSLFAEEYGRLLPILNEYEKTFSDLGMKLMYGPLDRNERAMQEDMLSLPPLRSKSFQLGFYFCLTKNKGIVYSNKDMFPLYESVPLLSERPGPLRTAPVNSPEFELQNHLYLNPLPPYILRHVLELFLSMVKKKKFRESESYLPFTGPGGPIS